MENNVKTKSVGKTGFTVLVLGLCWSIVYLVPFLQYTWYDPFREFLGGTHFQMSLLITIYGFGNIFLAPIGGWIADRFNYKWMYVGSVALNAVCDILFVLFPSYGFAILVWVGFAVSSLLMNYPTHIKIVRDLATDANQGKIFGWNETCIGIGNILLSAGMNVAFIAFGAGVGGIKGAVLANAGMSLILTIIVAFVLDNPKEKVAAANEARKKAQAEGTLKKKEGSFIQDFGTVAKHPETWCYALTIFAVYSFMSTLSYFTEYFTAVIGVTVVFSAWMSILRQYGMQLVGSPIGGLIADKIKSPAKLIVVVYIVGLACFIALRFTDPSIWSVGMIIAVTMIVSTFVYMARGCYYGTQTEVGVPRRYAATTAGVGAILGFSPDIFQFALYGHWLDTTENARVAYDHIFTFQIFVMIAGLIAAFAIIHYAKKHNTRLGGTYLDPAPPMTADDIRAEAAANKAAAEAAADEVAEEAEAVEETVEEAAEEASEE